jgi:hypothetical protein
MSADFESVYEGMRDRAVIHRQQKHAGLDKRKTHCKYGHARTSENLFKCGKCRLCGAIWERNRRARRKAAR